MREIRDAFLPLSFVESGAKNLNGGVGIGVDRTHIPASIVIWVVCEDSDITVR